MSGNLNFLSGAKSYPYMPKFRFRNRPVSSMNSEHTNKYIHTHIQPCVLIVSTSALCLLGRFAAEHNHTPTAKRLVCGLYTSNIDYKA